MPKIFNFTALIFSDGHKLRVMYQTAVSFARLPVADYIRDFRDAEKFIGFCRECGRYGRSWACPPHAEDPEAVLASGKFIFLAAEKIVPEPSLLAERDSGRVRKLSEEMLRAVRKRTDVRLLELEKAYPGSRAFFAGSCMLCPAEECTRISGAPCRYPDRIRPSLESYGFDIGRTASQLLGVELQWSRGGMPPYITLVSGLLTNAELPSNWLE